MYIRLALAVMVSWGGLLQAQVADSLAAHDSLYSNMDTVYIQQPPLVIKKQVLVHDTLPELSKGELTAQKFKKALSVNWYIDATLGLDHWLAGDEFVDTMRFHKRLGYSAAVSIGKEIGSFHVSVGIGTQKLMVNEQIEKLSIRYDSTKYKFIAKDPEGNDDCFLIGKKLVCVMDSIITHDTIKSKSMVVVNKYQIDYVAIPIKIGKRFDFDSWYVSPEIWIVPMFTLASNAFKESSKLKFNHKQTSYRIILNAGIPISKKLNVELGAGYQGSLGRLLLDMQFVNLHFGFKYYISKSGT